MSDLDNNRPETLDRYVGGLSLSYDYYANHINLFLDGYHPDLVIANIKLVVELNLFNGKKRTLVLVTNENGEVGLHYDLTTVESINISGLLPYRTKSSFWYDISHNVVIYHPNQQTKALTISVFVDNYYVDITGKLSDKNGKGIVNKTISLTAKNFDIEDHQLDLTTKTDNNGWYTSRFLLNNGDWEFEATSIDTTNNQISSGIVNIIERKENLTFAGNITTSNIDPHYTGFATYPSSTPHPSGSFELLETTLWDDDLYMGRIVREDNKFYFSLYRRGAKGNEDLVLPELFAIDQSNSGFIRNSVLIINDSEKYLMGRPISYDLAKICFDIGKDSANEMFDKYFINGKGDQSFKMRWLFSI